MPTFPNGTTDFFVSDITIVGDSKVFVEFIEVPGAQMGAGTIRWIELFPSVGFTIHLNTVCQDDIEFVYSIVGTLGSKGDTGVPGGPGPQGDTGSGGYLIKIDSADTTPDFIASKLVAGAGVSLTTNNIGGNESITIGLYLNPSVSLSGGSTNEKGVTVVNVPLSWTCNKSMVSRMLSTPVPVGDRNRGPGQNGSYTHNGANLTTTTTYTITVSDGTNGASSSTSVQFLNRRYYGVNSNTTLTNAQILALNKEFCSARSNTHTYDCTGGSYIWLCYPDSFGTATFYVNGLETTFTKNIQAVTNDSGYIENFGCYRSDNLQHGSDITVVVA